MSFAADGKLQTSVARNGWAIAYTYDGAGRLATVSNGFGHSLIFAYANDKLATVTAPGGRLFGYIYDTSGRLSSVSYPDGKNRVFLYENATFPLVLTGILDETGARWGTFSYDTGGRAVTSELAGGVERYEANYLGAGYALVTDPLGTGRSYTYGTISGKLAVTSGSLPSGEGKADASSRVQDANGLITSETDFKGVVTTTTWDVARRLPTSVTRASGAPEAQTVTTSWHPTFSLPVLVTETGRTTAYTYDTQGNRLSETVTHTAVSPNKVQTRSWTYTPQSLVATETAPNGGVTSYTYDSLGNVLSVTNAVGHVTTYTYDTANRVASSTAPNGLVTAYTWDLRDRLLTQTVGPGLPGAQTTTLTYKPFGTVETLTLPTGLVLTYTYDAAHRLTGWNNNRGESGIFTLDGMGNRVSEQIKNASGTLAWTTVRSVNAINRVASSTQGSNQVNTFGYDANGERISTTNGLNQSTQYGLDSLRRVTSITDAANASASLAYNALDDITQASDFKGVSTLYGRDAQGNALSETTPDAGARSTQYDSLGLPSKIVDALGQATTITRDALGRPTQLTFADGKTTTLTWDATAATKGYLSSISDRSGTTTYARDLFGRVTAKTQALISGNTQQVGYGYTASGQLASITYPGGGVLGHGYDATGRLTQLTWNGQPLVGNIAWNPLGQPTGWTWAFASPAIAASRSYDTAGRLTATEFSSYVYDSAGRITSLTQNLLKPSDTNPLNTGITSANTTWSVDYDATGRITSFAVAGGGTADSAAFGYDANGNRASSSRTISAQTTSRSYILEATSNKSTGFSQSVGAVSTAVSYSYNANGDLTGDGLRRFTYDAEGRLNNATTGNSDTSPTTRYAHNALGQRVFKTEAIYPSQGMSGAALAAYFAKGWTPGTVDAELLGYVYSYDEEGSLLSETGTGGANSGGSAQYVYLPTAGGAMPIAAVINGTHYAVQSDHLNTPRRVTSGTGQVLWQWAYSAFGDEEPTTAAKRFTGPNTTPATGTTTATAIDFKLRYPGQYADKESGLSYNWNRSFDPRTGKYTQPDSIGLDGGWNRFGYSYQNPLGFVDPRGQNAGAIGLGTGLGILGCALTPGCKQAVSEVLNSCGKAGQWIKDRMFSDGGSGSEKHPSTPTGNRGSPLDVEPGTNEPTTIDGRDYSGHALDRMQGRGVPPSAVEDAIQNGSSSPGNQPDTAVHVGPDGRVTVVTGGRGNVITVIPR